MVSVYEKCYLDRLASGDDVERYSPQAVDNCNVSISSDDIENVDNEGTYRGEHRNKFSLSQTGFPCNDHDNEDTSTIGKSNTSSCFSRPIKKSWNSNQSSRKRIIWNSRMINHINNTLRESSASSSSSSPSSGQNSFNESVNNSSEEEVGYLKKVFIRNCTNNSEETNEEHFSNSQSDNFLFEKNYQNTAYAEGKKQEICRRNKRRPFNSVYHEQPGEQEDSNRRNIPLLFHYKRKKETVNYDEILNRIRESAMVSEDWVKANQPKIVLLGDSHTRFLGEIIMDMLPWFKVEATVKPGAKSRRVLSSLGDILQNMGLNDFVVIISGTNDMWSESLVDAKAVMYDAINESNGTNLVLCNVPNNYLESIDSPVQDNILNFNEYYQDLVNTSKWAHLVNLYELKDRSLFTKHGLHFNQDGKIKICEMVSLKILEILDSIKT